jgi:GxxExxY protein
VLTSLFGYKGVGTGKRRTRSIVCSLDDDVGARDWFTFLVRYLPRDGGLGKGCERDEEEEDGKGLGHNCLFREYTGKKGRMGGVGAGGITEVWVEGDGVWFSGLFVLGSRLFRGDTRRSAEIRGVEMQDSELTSKVIAAALKVHRGLGPGLLESAYRVCLTHELGLSGLLVESEKPMPIVYDTIRLDHGYRMDLVVNNKLVVEIKTVEEISPVHFAQLLTYLRLGNYPYGLLINFHEKLLKDGIRRLINSPRNSALLRESPRN